jgi:hypothetical protein
MKNRSLNAAIVILLVAVWVADSYLHFGRWTVVLGLILVSLVLSLVNWIRLGRQSGTPLLDLGHPNRRRPVLAAMLFGLVTLPGAGGCLLLRRAS